MYTFIINKHKKHIEITVIYKDTNIMRAVPVNCVLSKEIRKAKKFAKDIQNKYESSCNCN